MASTSESMNPKCGFCLNTLHDNVLKSSKKFMKQCSVCFLESQLHSACAKKLYNVNCAADQRLQKNDDLSVDFFAAAPINFYCKVCKEKCFYCNNEHQCKCNY